MTAPAPTAAGGMPSDPSVMWNDPVRERRFDGWLQHVAEQHALVPHTLRMASADASFRRYFRIDSVGGMPSRIVMDAPPAQEDSAPFVRIAALMRDAGVPAPQILEWDEEAGFLLLEDFGHRTMFDAIDPADPDAARPLYLQAIDVLVRWQLASRPGVLPPYDGAVLARELALFPDWYVERHRQVRLDERQRAALAASFELIVGHNLASPTVHVHRDFMPRNLMVTGGDTLGVLDFQDALHGPVTYDIASLLRDAFLSWKEDFVIDITVRYWERARRAGLPVDDDFGAFYRAVEWMGLQRHIKVAGIFARLTLRDGKPRYLADAPRFIAYIRATASRYRELTPLLRVVDAVEGTQPATGFAYGRM